MPLPHLKIIKVKRNMAIFALQDSTDQPYPVLPSGSHSPHDATGCTRSLRPHWARALAHFALERWSQAEYFGPFTGLPLGAIQQLLFKVSVALWFGGLVSCHHMTAPQSHPV